LRGIGVANYVEITRGGSSPRNATAPRWRAPKAAGT